MFPQRRGASLSFQFWVSFDCARRHPRCQKFHARKFVLASFLAVMKLHIRSAVPSTRARSEQHAEHDDTEKTAGARRGAHTSVHSAAETPAATSAHGRSRFCQVGWHDMFHPFRNPGVPNAALMAPICTRDACGGRDMVYTQSIAAATE